MESLQASAEDGSDLPLIALDLPSRSVFARCDPPWVGVRYKITVERGGPPLQWLQGLTKRLFFLDYVVFHRDGTLRRSSPSMRVFWPIETRWRWIDASNCVYVDFTYKGHRLSWRWDELQPDPEHRFVPLWRGTGHAGKFTFKYTLSVTGDVAERGPSSFKTESVELSRSFGRSLSAGNTGLESFRSVSSMTPHHLPDETFYSLYADEQELKSRDSRPLLQMPPSCREEPEAPPRLRRARTNANRVTQYRWLEPLLESIVDGEKISSSNPTPLFVVAGSCPNRFSGMQAVLYCQGGSDIDFWFVKPKRHDGGTIEPETLRRHEKGPHKNTAEKSYKLYAPLAQKFSCGETDGDFTFGVDGDHVFIQEASRDASERMRVYLVWQELWSGPLARNPFIEGKLCYVRGDCGSTDPSQFRSRQYRIQDGRVWIAPSEDEEVEADLFPDDGFQEMYDMLGM
mmetsp:Transcript_15744/g.42927  ORF Transcript_15744/g.42927 Transcript_15744/m.42927 type:complete len:456 (-) Transcript_15744:321-1688(-)